MVIVVGAGICGLAAAYELGKRGEDVVVLEAEHPGAGQSQGPGRIFRIAHRTQRLCELAHQAREGWRRWERDLGLELLGEEGLVVTNGMWAGGEPLDRDQITSRVPLLKPDHPYDSGVWDPLAGSLRCELAIAALADRVQVRRAAVTTLEPLEADAVLVCAGLGTQELIAPLGLDLEMTAEPHVRHVYAGTGACLISEHCYALPTRDGYGIGMHEPGAAPEMFDVGEPVGTVECVSLFAPWLDHGDGVRILRAGSVIALGTSNAMKFAPLLGTWLADAVYGAEPWNHESPREPTPRHP
jgi:glycine/D-amino acid oxidase-like deaminating enzyme